MLLLLPFYIIIQKQIFLKVKNNNNNNSIKTSLTKQTTNGTDRPSSGEGAPQGAGDSNADGLTVGGNGSAHPPPPSNASWARCVPSAPGAAPAGWSVAGWGPSGQWSSCPPAASLGRQVPYTSPYRPENSGDPKPLRYSLRLGDDRRYTITTTIILFSIAPQQQLHELLTLYRPTNVIKHASICYWN